MADWTGIFVVIGVALLVFFLKYVIIRCYLVACRRRTRILPPNDPTAARDSIIIDILETNQQTRLGGIRGRKPPPKFETALKHSTPVSFITVTDDIPPPTYDEYLAMTQGFPPVGSSAHPMPEVMVLTPEIHRPMTGNETTKDAESNH